MKSPIDLRVFGGLIMTMDASRRELSSGCIEIHDGKILHVGETPTEAVATDTVRADDFIIIPGMVNSHVHTSQQLARGLADDITFPAWQHERIWPYELLLTEDDVYTSTMACAVEQIRNGVTTIVEAGGQRVDAMGRALTDSGLRGYVGKSTMDMLVGQAPPGMFVSTDEALAMQDDLASRWHGAADGRIRFAYTMRAIENCSEALIMGSVERARKLGSIVHMHVLETAETNDCTRERAGTTFVRYLNKLGALGPGFLAAHATYIDKGEMQILAETQTPVSHNVASNLRVLGIPHAADMRDAGICLGIGSDSAAVNNRMSLIDEIWMGALLQQGLRGDPNVFDARTMLEMATCNGARAASLANDVGSIEAGKSADFVLIDTKTINMQPLHNPVSALALCLKSENVHSVMCTGQWLMRDRVVNVCNEDELLNEVRGRAGSIARRIAGGAR